MNNLLHPLVEVCQVIVRTSGQAAVMVSIILAIQWLLRNRLSPAWRYGLWCLLVARLVLPVSLESGLSIFNVVKLQRAQRTEATQEMPAAQAIQATELPGDSGRLAGTPVVSGNSSPAPNSQLSTPSSQLQSPLPRSEPPAIAPQPARAVLDLGSWEIAALVWCLGACVFGVRLLWMNLRFRARLRDFEPISDHPSLDVLEECRAALKVRQRVELIESDLVQTPGVYGFWRKRLLVPEGTFERFDRSELRCIFLHELAHLRRRDLEINWLAALLQVLHWFNPVVWFAFGRMRADRELATDALALSVAASAPVTLYGETIIRVLERFSGRTALPGVVGIAENLSHIKQRMKAIAQFDTIKHWQWLAAAIALTLALVTLTDAQQAGNGQAPGAVAQTSGSNVAVPLAVTVTNSARPLPSGMALTRVSTNYTPPGADASYLEAVKIAVASGGPGVELLGVRVVSNDVAIYTFTAGTRGEGVGSPVASEITPALSAEPKFRSLVGDSRRPIVLSDWNISWQKARDIALAGGGQAGGRSLGLSLDASRDLVWNVPIGERGQGFFPHVVDAKSGEIVTQRQTPPVSTGPGESVTTPGGTDIRIRNGSSIEFKNVLVGGRGYGDIKPGEATAYQNWPAAFRYSSVSLLAEQKPLNWMPIDYVGEKPLGPGKFTYLLTTRDVQYHYDRLEISLVDDNAVANLQEQFAQETDPATKALKEWLAVFANAPQGGKPSAGLLIEQYGDKLAVSIGQMAVKGDPLIESKASGVEQLSAGLGELVQVLGSQAISAVPGLLDGLRRVRTAIPLNLTAYRRLVNLLSRVNADSSALEGILSSVQGNGLQESIGSDSFELTYSARPALIAIASRGFSNTVERLDKFVAHSDPDTRMLAVITMFTCCEPSDAGKAALSKFLTNGPTRQRNLLTSYLKDFKGRERAFFGEIADLFRRTGDSRALVNLGKDALPVINESLMSDDATSRQRGTSAVFNYVNLWHSSPGSLKDVEPLLPAVAEVNPMTFLTVVRMFQDQLKELSPNVVALVREMVESESVATSGSATRLLPLLPPPPAGPP